MNKKIRPIFLWTIILTWFISESLIFLVFPNLSLPKTGVFIGDLLLFLIKLSIIFILTLTFTFLSLKKVIFPLLSKKENISLKEVELVFFKPIRDFTEEKFDKSLLKINKGTLILGFNHFNYRLHLSISIVIFSVIYIIMTMFIIAPQIGNPIHNFYYLTHGEITRGRSIDNYEYFVETNRSGGYKHMTIYEFEVNKNKYLCHSPWAEDDKYNTIEYIKTNPNINRVYEEESSFNRIRDIIAGFLIVLLVSYVFMTSFYNYIPI